MQNEYDQMFAKVYFFKKMDIGRTINKLIIWHHITRNTNLSSIVIRRLIAPSSNKIAYVKSHPPNNKHDKLIISVKIIMYSFVYEITHKSKFNHFLIRNIFAMLAISIEFGQHPNINHNWPLEAAKTSLTTLWNNN